MPELLGPENAFQSLRRTELDYFEVLRAEDVVQVIQRFKREPGLYNAVVKNGLARAVEFTPDRIAQRWRDVLAGPLAEGYERWLRQGSFRRAMRPLIFASRMIADRIEIRRYKRQRDHGYRPISDTYT